METGLCLIQIEWKERSQASFISRLILTQTILRADAICITGEKRILPFQCPNDTVCMGEKERENRNSVVIENVL